MREPPGPVWGRAASCCLLPCWCSGRRVVCCRAGLLIVPVGGGPPASRPRRVLLLVALLVFRAPSGPAAREIATREPAARSGRSRSPPVPSGPSGALHTGGAWSLMLLGALSRSPAGPYRRPSISRVIPLRLVQTLNLQRWNCNVLGWSGACCYKRRQSKVFFVWISAPLLQTSSIHRLFR